MQRHAPVDPQVAAAGAHVPVHVRADQAEDDGLVAHQGLVVGLGVADGFLVPAPVGQLVPQVPHGPVLVGDLLDELDPVVRNPHGEAVVEAETAFFRRGGQPGHAAHVLGHDQGIRSQAVDHPVGQRQVGQRIFVDVVVEVVGIGAKASIEPVVAVEHAGDTVEAESVEPVFVQPEAAVGQQKMQDLDLAVVEAARVPGPVQPPRPVVEVLVQGAVEAAEALDLVGGGVGVNQVHDHRDPLTVGGVHQGLQVLGGPEAGAGRKEIGHLVAERGVVGVLLNGHELDGVVAGAHDARQNCGGELAPGPDFLLSLGHADVDLVDERCRGRPAKVRVAPGIGRGGAPDLGVEDQGFGVLNDPAGEGRDTVAAPPRPVDAQPVEVAVPQQALRQAQLPDVPGLLALERETFQFLPAGRVPDQENPLGIRRPLAQDPLVAPGAARNIRGRRRSRREACGRRSDAFRSPRYG